MSEKSGQLTITRPKWAIPSKGIQDATPQQYADYVAEIYAANCVAIGYWAHGTEAWGVRRIM